MSLDNLILLAVVIGIFVVPLLLANFISRAVRMPEQSWKIAAILFSFFAALAVCKYGWPPKLGIDLSGGSILVYEIDTQDRESAGTVDMGALINAVTKRVNPGGVKEVQIRPYGHNQIEIVIPKAEEAEIERIKHKISSTGMLQFRITANRRDHANIIDMAQRLEPKAKVVYAENGQGGREEIARWVPTRKTDLRYFASDNFVSRQNNKGETEVLVVKDAEDVTGGDLTSATPGQGPSGPQVDFVFNNRGARLFSRLTSNNLPESVQGFHRHLGIVLDGYLYSAPQINETISQRGQISGNFTREETEDLASVLNAGSLPTALRKEPSSSLVTGATLGADTVRKGVYSMLIATAAVVVFMVIYYRFAGVVANIALVLNVLLIVAFMVMFNAAFTLSGLAGLALTVGMAVDANVLIYERMREELARGATLRMAIRNGFERATTTIVDANVTTLISAVVLYIMGTDQVKGFAVTLILGIVMNLYTAIFVSRVFFDIAEKTRFITDLKMLHILSNPNFDFIGKRRIAVAFSVLLIAIGMIAVSMRGKGLLDIDFTGGVSVQVEFNEAKKVGEIRDAIAAVRETLPDTTVQDVRLTGTKPGTQFVINTSNPNIDAVEAELSRIFGGELKHNEITEIKVAAITPGDHKEDASKSEPSGDDAKATPEESSGAARGTRRSTDEDANLLALASFADDDPPAATDEKGAGAAAEKTAAEAKVPQTKAPSSGPAGPAAPGGAPAKSGSTSGLPVAPITGASEQIERDTTAGAAALGVSSQFEGGSKVTLKFDTAIGHDQLEGLLFEAVEKCGIDKEEVIFALDADDYEIGSDASFGTWTARTSLPPERATQVAEAAKSIIAAQPFFPASNNIGAAVASATQQQAAMAMIASLALILAYMWFRFSQVMFGVAGVLAVVHDVLVTLGALALSSYLAPLPGMNFLLIEPFKISLPIIAAFLTIIGYSLNDTIVIFDRIREVRGKSPEITPKLANDCINQTLSRTILTSLTVFIVVLILYIVGGEGIHAFAFALVVGVVAGTYSTIYIATPIVLWMNRSADTKSTRAMRMADKPREQITPA